MLTPDTLTHYTETYMAEWPNVLPQGCPPEDILIPEDEQFYRLLKNSDRMDSKDWLPYTELYPDRDFWENSIYATGLSLYKELDFKKLKMPRHRKFKGIAKITLNPPDGVLVKSFEDSNHYTFWPTKSFDDSKAEILRHD